VSTASTKALVSTLPNVDSISDDIIYSFFANGSQVVDGYAYHESQEISSKDWKESRCQWNHCYKWRLLLPMLWCHSVMELVAMIRAFGLMKNQQIMPSWHLPPQAHPVLQVLKISSESDDSVPISPINDRYKTGEGYHAVPLPYTGTFMPPKPDLVFYDAPTASETVPNVLNVESSTTKPTKDMTQSNRPSAFIIEDWVSDSKDESENYDFYEKQMVQKPVMNHAMRVNPHNSARMTHPHSNKHVVPTAILTRSRLVLLTTARPVTTAVTQTTIQVSHGLGPKKTLSFLFDVHGNLHQALKDKGVIDSGSSRHMTGNISYLSDFKEINRGYVAFGGNPKGDKITGKGKIRTRKLDFYDVYFIKKLKFNLFSVSQMYDKKNSVLFTNTECVVLSFDFKLPDENHVLLRVPKENNMYNVDLKNIVPSRDLTCLFAKATLDESNLWHRRLGRINFKTMNKLVKGNLVRGSPSKVFENNHTCVSCKKGKQHSASWIKREFSVAITPQQNEVTERKNRTLIEAARTMLADSLLPIPFWAKAVNTACYVQNKVLVSKPHNKTPYELLLSRIPSIGFIKPFGCLVTILNTLDPLGKFDEKADEGFLVGYFITSKAFRVFNSRTRIVQETLHINFLENQSNVVGSGPKWLFDIDIVTQSMNYQPVVVGNQPNHSAGIKENLDAGKVRKATESTQQYVLLPLWSTGSKDPQNTDADVAFDVKANENEVYVFPSSSNQPKKHDEKSKREAKGKNPVVYPQDAPVIVVGPNSTNSTNSFNAASPSDNAVSPNFEIGRKSLFMDPSQYPDDPDIPALEDIIYSNDKEDVGAEADFFNLETNISVSPIPTTRLYKDHHVSQIIGELTIAPQTRSMSKMVKEQGGLNQINDEDFHTCMFACFLSQEEPKRVHQALKDPSWIEAMQEELLQFKMQKVWVLLDLPKEEIYVCQPQRFEDPDYPDKVYKVVKALYGLHQAPRAWYETLANYLLENGFQSGKIDQTLFIKKQKGNILLVQVYVDDIIFGSTNKELCKAFEKLMKDKFQMSSMGELTFFFGLQVKQKDNRIFISQDKYVAKILRKFGFTDGKSASTPIDTEKPLLKNP
nr:ribonuclease H-like domain-containing protein [Tanacetum cinerariifolium]